MDMKKIFSRGFLQVFALVLILAVGTGLAYSRSDPEPVFEESENARPVTVATPFATGRTSAGVPWAAVTYETKAGWVCVDVRYWDPDNNRQMIGGCFIEGIGDTGRFRGNIPTSGEWVVAGLLEGPRGGIGQARQVKIEFDSGAPVMTEANARGMFVSVGRGKPVRLVYQSSKGDSRVDNMSPSPNR